MNDILNRIFLHWRTSSAGLFTILVAFLGNLTANDLQTIVDWFNQLMAQDNKVMRLTLLGVGLKWLLSKDQNTPTPPAPLPAEQSKGTPIFS